MRLTSTSPLQFSQARSPILLKVTVQCLLHRMRLQTALEVCCLWCKDITVIRFFVTDTNSTEGAALRKHSSAALDTSWGGHLSHHVAPLEGPFFETFDRGGKPANLQLLTTLPGRNSHMLDAHCHFYMLEHGCSKKALLAISPRGLAGTRVALGCVVLQVVIPTKLSNMGIRAFCGCEQLQQFPEQCVGRAQCLMCDKFEKSLWSCFPLKDPISDAFDTNIGPVHVRFMVGAFWLKQQMKVVCHTWSSTTHPGLALP